MGECITKIHEKYIDNIGKKYWGNKTPRLVQWYDIVAKEMPDVSFIYTVRDPRGVANSLKRSKAHLLNVLEGAKTYNLYAERCLEMEKEIPDRVKCIYYEKLVHEPEKIVSDLCKWLGISYESHMINDYYAQKTSVTKAEHVFKHHKNINKPIDSSSAEKWKEQLTSKEISLISYYTAKQIKLLGYNYLQKHYAPQKIYLLHLKIEGIFISFYKLIRNLWTRPNLFSILKRKLILGTFWENFEYFLRT